MTTTKTQTQRTALEEIRALTTLPDEIYIRQEIGEDEAETRIDDLICISPDESTIYVLSVWSDTERCLVNVDPDKPITWPAHQDIVWYSGNEALGLHRTQELTEMSALFFGGE